MAQVVAFGDSFVGPLMLFNQGVVSVVKIKGGTAHGLANSDSRSGARQQILQRCRSLPNTTKCLLFVFGNVDVHITMFYKYIDDPDMDRRAYIASCVSRYVAFLMEARSVIPSQLHTDFVVCSATLPVVHKDFALCSILNYTGIQNDKDKEDRLTRFLEENPVLLSLEHREECVRYFNTLLRDECLRKGFRYLDVNEGLVDDAGHVKPDYIDPSKANIHVLWEETIPLWLDRLKPYGVSRQHLKDTNLNQSASQYKNKKTAELRSRYPENYRH